MIAQLREVCRDLKTVSYLDMGNATTDESRRCQPTTEIFGGFATDTEDFRNMGRAVQQMRFGIGWGRSKNAKVWKTHGGHLRVKLREGRIGERKGGLDLPTESFGIRSVDVIKPPPDEDPASKERLLDIAAQFSKAVSISGSIAAEDRVEFSWRTVNWENEEERDGVFELVSTCLYYP